MRNASVSLSQSVKPLGEALSRPDIASRDSSSKSHLEAGARAGEQLPRLISAPCKGPVQLRTLPEPTVLAQVGRARAWGPFHLLQAAEQQSPDPRRLPLLTLHVIQSQEGWVER